MIFTCSKCDPDCILKVDSEEYSLPPHRCPYFEGETPRWVVVEDVKGFMEKMCSDYDR